MANIEPAWAKRDTPALSFDPDVEVDPERVRVVAAPLPGVTVGEPGVKTVGSFEKHVETALLISLESVGADVWRVALPEKLQLWSLLSVAKKKLEKTWVSLVAA